MSLDSFLSQLDPDKRGPQFERLCRWYLTNAPEYRGRFNRVWLWADWPGAWGPDAGIDLVAEEHNGDLWAIQAKAYDAAYAIKKADVDSFLSESSRPGFTYRLLIATTDRLGPTAKRTLEAQREPVGYLLRSQLALAPVEWPVSPDELRPRRPARKKPFPHVREAIRATVKGFNGTDRGQLLMACGTGKTLAAMWIAERLDSKRTLVLVPSLSLLGQTLREWSANATKPFDYLAVCSDETVAGEDKFVQHTAELGLPVTTDPKVMAAFLRRRGRRVVFATYQSSPQIAVAFKNRTPAFDLAIADEAHRCAGRVGTEFTTILDPERISARRRLFMTATPRYYTQRLRREAGELDVEVASMDDEGTFGPVHHRLSFGEAIERDLLSDYQVVVVGVTDSMYRRWAEHGEFVTLDGEQVTDARSLAGQIGLAKTMRKYDLERIVSFHSRVAAARRFADELPAVIAWLPRSSRPSGSLWAEHVSGAMSSGVRDARLRHLRAVGEGERGLLSNARCLGEGVDVPTLDGVAFIDPRRSTIDIIQALGRAIRKAPEKQLGTIVIPVFVEEDADPEEALDTSAFKHVWDVLKALRAHDEQLAEELDELRRRLGALRAPPKRPGKIKLDVPSAQVGTEFAQAFDARLVEQTTTSWEFYFGLLDRFVKREGHARIPDAHREDGYRLGGWVRRQRVLGREGRLEPERRARLEALLGWTWEPFERDWEEGFAHLQRFVEREGHALVPAQWREDGYRLGQWVTVQRSRRETLDEQRQARLGALPGWAWNAREAGWKVGFAHLVSFVEREGHALVPATWREGDYGLGSWVNNQRVAFGKGQLDATKRVRLESLPEWIWDAREAIWKQGFTSLESYVEREGHARVPRGHRETGYALGNWVERQRLSWRKGRLEPERRALLEALPGWIWDPREADWEEGFAHLRSFVDREGHPRVPRGHREDGYLLEGWVLRQRVLGREERLEPERRARLEALPGWTWDTREAAWEDGYARLLHFVELEGHSRVPQSYREDDGFGLGGWVTGQRSSRKRGDLSEERTRALEALPVWTWDSREADWEEGFAHLQRFVEREGHALVPAQWREAGYRLGQWIGVQRIGFRDRTLDQDRQARLEALPGWTWHVREGAWEEGFAYLKRFVEREGHARVPRGGWLEDGYALGAWVKEQRYGHRAGTLNAKRRARLKALPGWTWSLRESTWEEGFAHLKRFVEREGHARVPQSYREDGFRLGVWVTKSRQTYRRGMLDPVRRARLEHLPRWTWDTLKAAWEEGFAHLERFVEREGHARVPQRWQEDGFRLGQWVAGRRHAYRKGTLDPERRARLEALPGWTWDRFERDWEEGLAQLQRFVEREGHARVPYGYRDHDGFKLGPWVSNHRNRRGQLSKERVRHLEALPGWTWDPAKADWEHGFAHLERFVDREDHARVPQSYREDGFGLGRWVSKQRQAYRNGKLDPERRVRLEALPGWSWAPRKGRELSGPGA